MPQWCCYRGNPQHTGCVSSIPPLKGHIKWTYSTEETFHHAPTLAGNILYAVSDRCIYAIETEKGTLLWKYPSEGIYSPIVVDKTVYFGGKNGLLYALDCLDGTEKWTYSTEGEIKTSPAVLNRHIYIGAGDRFYDLELHTGKERWIFNADYEICSSPVVFGGIVFFGAGNIFYAVDARRGRKRWAYRTKIPIYSSPALHSGCIYLSAGYLYALDIINGARKWITEIEGDEITETPVVTESSIFIASKSFMTEINKTAGVLYSIDAATGSRQWAFFSWDNITSPAVVDNFMYLGAGDGKIYALDIRNGLQKWCCEVDTRAFSSPAAGDGCVFIGGNEGKIYAIT